MVICSTRGPAPNILFKRVERKVQGTERVKKDGNGSRGKEISAFLLTAQSLGAYAMLSKCNGLNQDLEAIADYTMDSQGSLLVDAKLKIKWVNDMS